MLQTRAIGSRKWTSNSSSPGNARPLEVEEARQLLLDTQGQHRFVVAALVGARLVREGVDGQLLGFYRRPLNPRQPGVLAGLELRQGGPALGNRGVAAFGPAMARLAYPLDLLDFAVRAIYEEVAASGGARGEDDHVDRLLGQACQIVGGSPEESQLLESSELGRQPALALGGFGQTFAHPDVREGDRDDPGDRFEIALVEEGRPFGVGVEVADEGAEQAVGLPDREYRLRGDAALGHLRAPAARSGPSPPATRGTRCRSGSRNRRQKKSESQGAPSTSLRMVSGKA